MAEDAGSIYSEIRIRLDKLGIDIAQAEARIKRMGTDLDAQTGKDSDKISKNYTDSFGKINIGAAAMAAGATAAFKSLVSTFASTEQSLANVRAVTGASATDFDKLKKAAVEAGDKTRFSASQAADAMYYLAGAGFDASQTISALDGVLLLAGATGSDLADTAATLTATISQFGLAAGDSADVANTLAAAIGNSQATIDKLSTSLRSVGPVAGTLNIGLEETTASLQALYNAGFTGETAGTALRNILLDLSNASGPVVEKLAQVGVTFDQINPQKVGLTGAIEALSDSGVAATDIMSIFGKESAAQMGTLLDAAKSAEKDGLRALQAAITDTNKAAEQYALQNDTLAGSFDEFTSKAETASNSFIETLTPAFRAILGVGGELLGFISKIPTGIQGVIAGFATFGGAVLALNGVLGVLGITLGAALGPIGLIAGVIGAVAVGISSVVAESSRLEELRVAEEFGGIAEQAKRAGENIADVGVVAKGIERQFGALSIGQLELSTNDLKTAVKDLAKQYGVSEDTVAKILLASSKITEEQKKQIDAVFGISKKQNEIAQLSRWEAENARGRALQEKAAREEAEKQADAKKKLNALLGGALDAGAKIANIDKLVAAGVLDENEALEQKIKLRQEVIEQIKEQGISTGSLTAEQKKQLEIQNASLEKYQERLDFLEQANMTELERRKATIQLITDEETRAFEEFKLQLDEKLATLETAGVSELELEAYKAEQIKAYENQKVLDRQNTLILLQSAEDQAKAQFEKDLADKIAKLKAAGATELEIANFTNAERKKKDAETQDAITQKWLADYNTKVGYATNFATAINSLYQNILDNQISDIDYETKKKLQALDAEYDARLAAGEDQTALDKEYADRKTKIEEDAEKEIAQLKYQAAIADWWLKQAQLLAGIPGMVITASTQLGPIAGPIVAGGIAIAQEAALIKAYPTAPRFETGGIVIGNGGSNGSLVSVAENGTSELLLNSGESGRPFVEEIADIVASKVNSNVQRIVIELDGKVVAESTVSYINNGQVRVQR